MRPGRVIRCDSVRLVCIAGLASLVLLSTGCAGWKKNVQAPTLTANREERAAEAVREFEEHRDAAQLEAALDRFKQGDVRAAEAMLATIVARRPDHTEARLRLAELLWSRGDLSAEGHLRAVLQAQPNRAEAHHALGLLLDGTNRGDEARYHFAQAAALDPQNEIYRQTCGPPTER